MSRIVAFRSRRSPNWPDMLLKSGLLAAVSVLLLFYFRRTLNLDEGWYLLAARQMQQGYRPYLDFSFTQGPVMPWLYAQLLRWLPLNLYTGRAITLMLAGSAWGTAVWGSWRLFGKLAAALTLWTLVLGWFAVAHYTYVATYALAGALLVAGMVTWLGTSWRWRFEIAGLLLALAVGVRLSLLPILLLFWIAAWLEGTKPWPRRWLATGLSLGLLAVIFGPFWLRAPDLLWYNLLGFHTDRISWAEHVQIWRAALSRDVRMFAGFWALLTLRAGLAMRRQQPRPRWQAQQWLLLAVLLMFGVHLIPRTADAYYNTLQYPLMAMLMGKWLIDSWQQLQRPALRLGLAVVLILLMLLSQVQALQHYHLYWRPGSALTDVARWHDFMQEHVAATCKGQGVSFTPLLAIEGASELAPGLEMGIFAYRPTWKTARSQHFHAVNNDILADLLRQPQVGWAAFSRYDLEHHLYGNLDEIKRLLRHEFRLTKTFPALGAGSSEVYLYLRPHCFQGTLASAQAVAWQEGIHLLGASWQPQRGVLTLLWQPQQVVSKDYTIFVHILDEQGVLVFGQDEPPCRGTCASTTWQPGERILDEHLLALPPLPPGRYLLELGLYDETVQRLPLTSGADAWIIDLDALQ
jgi:hypothetical protein